MPLATRIQTIRHEGRIIDIQHRCVLVRDGANWSLLDPETNNLLIRNASTAFIRAEVTAGRLQIERSWRGFLDPT